MAKIERTKNALRNILFGILLKFYNLLMPFLMRTALIYLIGIQYLGLDSLFTAVLQFLNMAELGVGSVMVYSMYQPIVKDDTITICALMNLYKLYYRLIGLFIAVIGFLLTPFLPRLIAGNIPSDINIYVLYYLNLGATVLSYWLFAYKNSLFLAHQRTDIVSKITFVTNTFKYTIQILVLWLFKNYYYYVIVMLVTQVFSNIFTAFCANKMFPLYKPVGNLPNDEIIVLNRRIKDLFSAKLGTVLSKSVNSIVISSSLGLTVLAIYHNYYSLVNAMVGFFIVFFSSTRAGIGNSLILESSDKNYMDFKAFAFIILWFSTVSISCFMTTCQPFMKLWVGDRFLLPYHMVILFCIYFFMIVMQDLSCLYKDASGIWHEDRYRPLITGVVNFILNIVLIHKWGLAGVLFSTIVSYIFIAMPWLIYNLFHLVFDRSSKEYIIQLLLGFLLAMSIGFLCYGICCQVHLNGLKSVVVYFLISVSVSNIVLFLMYRRNPFFLKMLELIKRKVVKH